MPDNTDSPLRSRSGSLGVRDTLPYERGATAQQQLNTAQARALEQRAAGQRFGSLAPPKMVGEKLKEALHLCLKQVHEIEEASLEACLVPKPTLQDLQDIPTLQDSRADVRRRFGKLADDLYELEHMARGFSKLV